MTFKCGLIDICDAGRLPDYGTVTRRIRFAQEEMGLNAVFLTAFQDEDGRWVMPFFSAEDSMGRFARPEGAIRAATPYHVVGIRAVDVPTADMETLRILSTMYPDPAPAVRAHDLMPADKSQIERPEEVFDGLVGMDSQREILTRLSTAVAKHGTKAVECFHFVFAGPPGTGKTELATRLASYFDLIGLTDGSGKLVKVGEADLVAKYVGHTAPKVRQVVDSAIGGVLFIDEFYAIANAPHFGREAIDALVDQLDTHRHDFVCIIAGYPEEIDSTLDLNPGLRDRFGYRIDFPSYGDEELTRIFVTMAGQRGFVVEDERVVAECAKRLRESRGFSNARTMRKLVDHAVIHASCARDEPRIVSDDVFAATNQVLVARQQHSVGFR